MTFAEIERLFASKSRVLEREEKNRLKEKAIFDYALADLIGKSVARCFSKENTYPDIAEAYPTLFDSEAIAEKKQEKEAELFAAKLKQFANFHNSKLQEVQND
jgi:hypothetical protein